MAHHPTSPVALPEINQAAAGTSPELQPDEGKNAMHRIRPILALLCALVLPAATATAADFSGKTVTLYVGYGPGGGYDTYARVFARDFGRHLPGKPTIVVQNQPGAGSLTAANSLYNIAPKDGTAIALFAASVALGPALGNTQARFDTAKFNWIGNIVRDVASCGVWKSSPVKTWPDIMTKTVRIGASGPDAITTQHALFLRNMLGAKIDVILGYGGTNDINLAMQRGEVDGTCGMFLSSVTGPYQNDIKAGNLKIIVQFGRKNAPEFGDAANIYDLLKTEEDKQVADFVFLQTELTRPIAAPPGLPTETIAALRKGFDDTMADPEFLANAQKANIDIRPMTGTEVAGAFAQFAAMPPKILERAKAAISNNN